MPFFIQPFFRKPFKLFAIDADTGQPLDSNVRKKTRVTYYEIQNGSNGSKRLVAHKTPSQISKQADEKSEGAAKSAEDAKKDGDENSEDAPWTEAQDKTIIAMKGDNKIWADIVKEVGRPKHEVQARWKEINRNKGDNGDAGKKDNGGGGGNQGEHPKENKRGNEQANGQGQGQGKKNKKGNNQNTQQNNNNNQEKNDNKQNNNQQKNSNKQNNNKKFEKAKNQNGNQNKNDNKSKQSKQSNNQPANNGNSTNEARFTMNDWLTLQEDDIFSFGELQCLSELIAKDLNQGWQRVAAKFFDLTGRRVHPDDVREKFESMAVAAERKK